MKSSSICQEKRPDISSQLPLLWASTCNGTNKRRDKYLLCTHPTLHLRRPNPSIRWPSSRSGKQASQPGSLKRTDIQADGGRHITSHPSHTKIFPPLFLRTAHLESEHQDTPALKGSRDAWRALPHHSPSESRPVRVLRILENVQRGLDVFAGLGIASSS